MQTKPSIPLCRAECALQRSPINRHLRHWIFLEREMALYEASIPAKPKSQVSQLEKLPVYVSSPPPPDTTPTNFISNQQYKRISPELLEMMEARHVDVIPQREPRTRLNFTTIDTRERRDLEDEILSPALAAYLHSVMEKPDFFTELYDINFYDNHIEEFDDKLKYLDRNVIEHLFRIIHAGGKLSDQQIRFLKRFIEAVSELNTEQLTTYLAILRANGLLTLDVLFHLNEFMHGTGIRLPPAQMTMMLNVFNIMAEAAIRGQTRLQLMSEMEKVAAKKRIRRSLEEQHNPENINFRRQHRSAILPEEIAKTSIIANGVKKTLAPASAPFGQRATMPPTKVMDAERERKKGLHNNFFTMDKAHGMPTSVPISENEMKNILTAAKLDQPNLNYSDKTFDEAATVLDIETHILEGMTDPDDLQRRQTFLSKGFPEGPLLTFPKLDKFGRPGTAAHRPRDVRLPWRGFQQFFKRALLARLARPDLNHFPYARAMERYLPGHKKRKEQELLKQSSKVEEPIMPIVPTAPIEATSSTRKQPPFQFSIFPA